MHDSVGFKTPVGEITADVVEGAREWVEFKVEPADVTQLLQPHDETWADGELLLINEQRKRFLEMESTDDAVKTVEMTTKD